jgi:arylsulfatase A-like enzyme
VASSDPSRPNILFILSDDQGAWAMNCAGTPELRTPNLDRLAETGIRFENFFCASPVCSPARASILTGQIPSQHGVQDFLRAGSGVDVAGDGKTIKYLEGRITYTQLLADCGYDAERQVAYWRFGNSAGRVCLLERPCDRGGRVLQPADVH